VFHDDIQGLFFLGFIFDQPGVSERVRTFAGEKYRAIKKAVASTKKVYIVQPGDSLWLIAQKTLGDGSRYDEILRANSQVIDDEESISVGTKLKIPSN
jgi:nucleoid-associated protein YgaU